jgi:hypothetical protein
MRRLLTLALAASLLAGSALAQAGSLEDFVVRANRIPLNATALLRPDAHRLRDQGTQAFRAVGEEIRDARAAGRRPPACPPQRMQLNVTDLLAHLNAIPQARRRTMSVTDGIRSYLAARHPCPN